MFFPDCGNRVNIAKFYSLLKLLALVKVVLSQNGLLTTVAYKLGPDQPTVYALEVSYLFKLLGWLVYKQGQGLMIGRSLADLEHKV